MMEYNFLKTGKFALRNPFRRKPNKDLSFFDKLVNVLGTNSIEVYNGVTYSGERVSHDGCEQPIDFNTEKWFKIKVGRFISGRGDWGNEFEYTSCSIVEIYIDSYCNILRVCACEPFYNSPTRKTDLKLYEKAALEVNKFNAYFALNGGRVKFETQNQWLKGVLETIYQASWVGDVDFWKHAIIISNPDLEKLHKDGFHRTVRRISHD